MKRKLLASVIAGTVAAVSAPAVLADASVYGKVDVSLQQIQQDVSAAGLNYTVKDNWEMMSNASRFGFKGNTDISDEAKAIFKIEYEYGAATGSADATNTIKSRNVYAGIQTKSWGTLIAGRNDTPLKLAQGKIDEFNDYYMGDLKYVMVGDNRENNVVMYTSPTLAGFSGAIAFMPGQADGCNNPVSPAACVGSTHNDNGFANKLSGSITYKLAIADKSDWWITAAHDKNVQNTDITRIASQLTLGGFRFGIISQDAKVHENDFDKNGKIDAGMGAFDGIVKDIATANTFPNANTNVSKISGVKFWNKQSGLLVSAAYTIGDWTVKAEHVESKTKADSLLDPLANATIKAEENAIGLDYALSAKTTVYTYYSKLKAKPDSFTTQQKLKSEDWNTFGVGFDINF